MKFELTPLRVMIIILIPILLAGLVKIFIMDKGPEKDKDDLSLVEETDWPSDIEITTSWLLPEELKEVSGITWVDSVRFACVQDELGKVFIFNSRTNVVDRSFTFGPKGDYEAIALAGSSLYVLEATGNLYEISNYTTGNPVVQEHKTPLKKKQDSESLAYDQPNDRLLIAEKSDDEDLNSKGIYAFDLKSKKMDPKPVFVIDFDDKVFEFETSKKKRGIRPSDIAIHPVSRDIYVLEGTNPQLLIMDPNGKIKTLIDLKKSDFPQPEGLCFSSDGLMYISNEGTDESGNILQVKLNAPLD